MNYHESEYTDMGIILQDVILNIEEREREKRERDLFGTNRNEKINHISYFYGVMKRDLLV